MLGARIVFVAVAQKMRDRDGAFVETIRLSSKRVRPRRTLHAWYLYCYPLFCFLRIFENQVSDLGRVCWGVWRGADRVCVCVVALRSWKGIVAVVAVVCAWWVMCDGWCKYDVNA